MKLQDHYDLIVVGNQLSGLFLAAGAAQAGLKVLVLEEASVPTVLYEIPSGRLLGDFAAEPVIGLEAGSGFDKFLQSLGLYQNLEELFPFHDQSLQIVAPRMRLNFTYRPAELGRELNRELDWKAEKIEAFGRVLSGVEVSRGNFSDLIAKQQLPVAYESFGNLQPALYGSMVPRQLSYATYRTLVGLGARGVRFPLGGHSGLKERLISRILVFGGTLRRSTRVEEIVFERGHLTGVLLSSYEGFVRSPRVVGALDAKTFFGLLPPAKRPKRLSDAIKNISPRYWRLSFTVLVPEAVLPEGMGSHVALLDPSPNLEQDSFLQLQVFRKDSYGGIPAGHVALVGRLLLPFEAEGIRPRFIARALKRALLRLEEMIPFLKERPYTVSPDPEKLEQDFVFQRYYSFRELEDIPTIFRVYESGLAPGPDSPGPVDWSAYGLAGIALCSRDIRPYEGFVGEVATAMDLLSRLKAKKSDERGVK